ncbi:MAG: hypothetical protein R3273_10660 [Pseudidiomarina maritima]|uniref:Uncharacterized protein n=1 Tax=Pseudidiomarina aestuarii TaxID=624146 RepID=A0A2T4CNM1_9GAMM|nr:hypothetical protein [Pseudidiomarina maritima]PTB83150.1 hypothetical protein C9986_01015 [Pseudidiomarina aestuarii]PTB88965.1 hypothetical protein C9927_02865 [Pseudidiomarina aestuarii]
MVILKSAKSKIAVFLSALAVTSLVSGCAGSASASISTTCTGGTCSTTAKAEAKITFKVDHEGNQYKELYAYVQDELIELDFAQLGIQYSGQNAYVAASSGSVDVILKSFTNEVARRSFSYVVDSQNTAKFSNPAAVKSWILTYDGIDEFNIQMNDIQTNFGSGNVAVTSTSKYAGVSYASSTYSGYRDTGGGGGNYQQQ